MKVKIGRLQDFPDQRTSSIMVNEQELCVARVGNQLTAFEDSCTHQRAMLSQNNIVDGCVACPLHGAKFSITTGQALTPPAFLPLKMIEVLVEGDDVFLNI